MLKSAASSYPTKESPLFRTGAGVSLMAALLQVLSALGLAFWCFRQNKKKAKFLSEIGPDYAVCLKP